jgi:hypothetical protein
LCNVDHYAAIVHDKGGLRRLGAFAHTLISDAYDAPGEWMVDHTEEVLASAEHDLAEIAGDAVRKPAPNKSIMLKSVLWKLEQTDAIPTGIKPVDDNFAGFLPSEITVLGARTSGKPHSPSISPSTPRLTKSSRLLHARNVRRASVSARNRHARPREHVCRKHRWLFPWGKRKMRRRRYSRSTPLEIIGRPLQLRSLRLECKRLMLAPGGLIVDYLSLMCGN